MIRKTDPHCKNLAQAYRHRAAVMLVATLLFINCTCDNKQPVESEQIADIYAELVLSSLNSTPADSMDNLRRVLAKHGITPEQFESSRKYCENHPEIWLSVMKKVVRELEHQESSDTTRSDRFVLPQK